MGIHGAVCWGVFGPFTLAENAVEVRCSIPDER